MSKSLERKIQRLETNSKQAAPSEVSQQARKFVDFLIEFSDNEGLSPSEELELARKHGLEVTREGVVKSGL